MNERIDHAAEALSYLYPEYVAYESSQIRAQVHAMLALVEQQRIANLIALHRHEVKYDIGSWSRLYDEGEELRPEIKEALGIE